MTERLTLISAAIVATLAGIPAASAHARLESAVPAIGSTVAAPDHIALFFSEGVVPGFSGITVTDAAGQGVKTGKLIGKGAELDVTVSALRAGTYTVRWHAVSVDTHRTQGSFRFTVAP